MEDEFRALVRDLNLPAGATVEHGLNFEADEITLSVKAADAETLARVHDALERGLAAGSFEEMLSIARHATDASSRKMKEG
jgi:flagellar basal body P-ring protein FlgI